MATQELSWNFRPRLWIAVATTILTCIVSLLASVNLYLLEDGNPLTQAAYSASPLVRYPVTFLVFFLLFVGLSVISLLAGRTVATRSGRYAGRRSAAIVGACFGAFVVLLVNAVSLVVHTLALNPVSHALFIQGQMGETHFNSLVIAMVIEVLLLIMCALSLWFALRSPARA